MEPTGTIGQSVVIKGELSAKEDLTIECQVEGQIEMEQNMLTVGVNGRIKAQVLAKAVVVMGTVTGDITATEKINLCETASVEGDLDQAPQRTKEPAGHERQHCAGREEQGRDDVGDAERRHAHGTVSRDPLAERGHPFH